MKLSRFEKAVFDAVPQISSVEGYFYLKGVDNVLHGFVYETARNGAYLSKWYFPLYQKIQGFHLTYSERIEYPEGYIDFDKVEKKDRVDAFVNVINKYIPEVSRIRNHSDFIMNEIERSERWAKKTGGKPRINEHTRKVLAFSFLLCDEFDKAEFYWSEYLKSGRHEEIAELNVEYCLMKEALEKGFSTAKDLVNSWIIENKTKYNIT